MTKVIEINAKKATLELDTKYLINGYHLFFHEEADCRYTCIVYFDKAPNIMENNWTRSLSALQEICLDEFSFELTFVPGPKTEIEKASEPIAAAIKVACSADAQKIVRLLLHHEPTGAVRLATQVLREVTSQNDSEKIKNK